MRSNKESLECLIDALDKLEDIAEVQKYLKEHRKLMEKRKLPNRISDDFREIAKKVVGGNAYFTSQASEVFCSDYRYLDEFAFGETLKIHRRQTAQDNGKISETWYVGWVDMKKYKDNLDYEEDQWFREDGPNYYSDYFRHQNWGHGCYSLRSALNNVWRQFEEKKADMEHNGDFYDLVIKECNDKYSSTR